jgi:hypothetical protein
MQFEERSKVLKRNGKAYDFQTILALFPWLSSHLPTVI